MTRARYPSDLSGQKRRKPVPVPCWALACPDGIERIYLSLEAAKSAVESHREYMEDYGPWRIVAGSFVPKARRKGKR